MISQPRPHADNEFEPETTEDMVVEQIPMGFLDKVIGQDQMQKFESKEEGAKRETGEETGATVVKDISYPEYPKHYPNPTFIGTTSDLVFVEVDLERIEELRLDRSEPIFKAEYIPLDQLLKDIKEGKTERGYALMCTSNSTILIFISGLRQYANANRNEKILNVERQTHKEFKKENSKGYLDYMLRRSRVNKPERFVENKARAEKARKRLKQIQD